MRRGNSFIPLVGILVYFLRFEVFALDVIEVASCYLSSVHIITLFMSPLGAEA